MLLSNAKTAAWQAARPLDEWMDESEAAAWLKVGASDIHAAVLAGELPALRIGGNFRISRSRLLGVSAQTMTPMLPVEDSGDEIPPPAALTWLEDMKPTGTFTHGWPRRGGGTEEESYPLAWSGTVVLGGSRVEVLVGETRRYERGRLTVFFDDYPVAEFMDTQDGIGWVSVIKPDGKKTIQSTSELPPLYVGTQVSPYHAATGASGSGRPTGLAVVIGHDDLRSAVHHAAARQVGKTGRPVIGPPSYFWIEVEVTVPRSAHAPAQTAMVNSIGSAYNSQMLRHSEVSWSDSRTAIVRMAAGGMTRKDAERSVIEMTKRHVAGANIASEQAAEVRVLNSTIFDPIAYRMAHQKIT